MKASNIISLATALVLTATTLTAETTDPKLVVGDKPVYSNYARSHALQGTVVVEALVDEQGRVFAADVVESVHSELDKAAVAAVSDWKFEPAMEDGKAVIKVVRIPIHFDLIDPIKESLRSHDTAVASNK